MECRSIVCPGILTMHTGTVDSLMVAMIAGVSSQ